MQKWNVIFKINYTKMLLYHYPKVEEGGEYTLDELERYKKYVQEWEYLVRSDRDGFVPWLISNNFGDPFNIKDWKEREYLHNFKGINY